MKKSLVLLVITLLVAAYVYYFEVRKQTKTRSTEEVEKVSKTVVGAQKQDILGFALKKAGGEPIAVEFVNGEWVMTSPVNTTAEEGTVNSVLWDIEWTEKEDTIPAADVTPERLKAYGLDSPRGTISVTLKDGTREFIIGGPNLAGTSVYVRDGENGPVYVAKKALAENLDTTVLQMRSKTIMPLVASKAGYIRIYGTSEAALEKKDNLWNLTEPFKDYGDAETITTLLKDAAALEVVEFVSDDPATFAQYGLDNPASYITIAEGLATGKRYTINFGNEAPAGEGAQRLVYASVAAGKSVFTLKAEAVEKLFPSASDLQCRTLVRFDQYALKDVAFTYGMKEVVLAKPDFDWKVTKPFEADADAAGVSKVINAIQKARITQFVTADPEKGKHGLETPSGSFSFTEAGKATLGIVFGGDAGEGLVYVKRTDTPGVYRVAKEILEALNVPALSLHTLEMQRVLMTDVGSFKITRGDDSYVIKYAADAQGPIPWRMAEPADAPVNPVSMTVITSALATTRAAELVTDESGDPAQYGLDKPAAEVGFSMKAGAQAPKALLVGKRLEEGKRYAMLEGGKLVFTIPGVFARALFEEVRDPRVFVFDTVDASQMAFTYDGGKVVLSKQADGWAVDDPAARKAKAGAAAAELAHLAGLETAKFVSYKTAELANYNLDKPQAAVRVILPTGVAALSVGKTAETGYYYATSTTVDGVFLLTPGDVANVVSPENLLEAQQESASAPPAGAGPLEEKPQQAGESAAPETESTTVP